MSQTYEIRKRQPDAIDRIQKWLLDPTIDQATKNKKMAEMQRELLTPDPNDPEDKEMSREEFLKL